MTALSDLGAIPDRDRADRAEILNYGARRKYKNMGGFPSYGLFVVVLYDSFILR